MYEGSIEGEDVRGRPTAKWLNKVDEYWGERERGGRLEIECTNRMPEQGRLEIFLPWSSPWESSH